MICQDDFVQPPRIATCLVNLFSPVDQANSILGDLVEEFSDVALRSGNAFARRWYWRQTVRTIAHLVAAAFRTAPLTITGAVIGGYLLRWFVSQTSNPVVQGAVDAVLHRYRIHELNVDAYLFWLKIGMLMEHLILNLLIGGVVAVMAKGREMTAAITLGLVGAMLAVQATLLAVAGTGDHALLWTLPHTFAFSVAIVIAGAVVRTRRSARTTSRPAM